MAIPISMPNADDAEESYRSLDLLLEQLLMTLRQVLMHRRREIAASVTNTPRYVRNRYSQGPTEAQPVTTRVTEEEEETTRLPLPDLVQDVEPECAYNRQQQGGRKTPETFPLESSHRTNQRTTTNPRTMSAPPHTWVQVGAELRRIADLFRATNSPTEQEESKPSRMKEVSLLSLLCPPLGGSMWTTVALLVGWGLLSRKR